MPYTKNGNIDYCEPIVNKVSHFSLLDNNCNCLLKKFCCQDWIKKQKFYYIEQHVNMNITDKSKKLKLNKRRVTNLRESISKINENIVRIMGFKKKYFRYASKDSSLTNSRRTSNNNNFISEQEYK